MGTFAPATIIVIDDDPSIREALDSLLRSVGQRVKLFGSVQEFLANKPPDGPSCLVLDIRLPDKSGLEFQEDLRQASNRLPANPKYRPRGIVHHCNVMTQSRVSMATGEGGKSS